MYLLLPFFLLIMLLKQFLETNYAGGYFILGALGCTLFCYHLFLKNYLRYSIITLCTQLILIVTGMCTVANGIHDVAIIAFPIIIGFSSLILENKDLTFTTLISLIAIVWLALGDEYGLYFPNQEATADIGDFVVVSALIVIGGVLAYSLNRQLQGTLAKANFEISQRRAQALVLKKDLAKVMEMTQEIHSNVSNSLNLISKTLALKKISPEMEESKARITRKIIALESAHQVLFETRDIEWVDLEAYSEVLLKLYKNIHPHVSKWTLDFEKILLPLDDIVAYGICLIESINNFQWESSESIDRMAISGYTNEHYLIVKIAVKKQECRPIDTSELVLNLMIKQLNGEIKSIQESQNCITSFHLQPSKMKKI